MMRPCRALLTVSVFAGLTANLMAADPTIWLPAEINAVARVSVADIYKSPLALKEGWLKKSTEAFVQQEAFVPPGTSMIVVGADLDTTGSMTANRTYSVLVPDKQMSLDTLTAWVPGRIEKVSGKSLGNFGIYGYVADAGDGCWLTNGSSNRQLITHWLRTGVNPGGNQMSPYLRSVLSSNEAVAPLTMAIDLQDTFSGQDIKDELAATDWFKTPSDADAAASVLETVRGITIHLYVSDKSTGQVTFDFGTDTAPIRPILDKLAEAVLQHAGISGKEVEDWKWLTKGKQVVGSGAVSPGAGRRIVSILEPPSIAMAISSKAAETANAPAQDPDAVQKVSLKYTKSLQVLLEDLRKEMGAASRLNPKIVQRYARKMDNLPSLNVDAALLDFSAKVSNSLRYQGQSIRMNNLDAVSRKTNSMGTSYYNYNSVNGYVGSYTATPFVGMSIDASKNEASRGVVYSEWKQIEDGLVAVRRAMTEKYKVQF